MTTLYEDRGTLCGFCVVSPTGAPMSQNQPLRQVPIFDRRASKRFAVRWPVRTDFGRMGGCMDISVGGMAVRVNDVVWHHGDRLSVMLEFSRDKLCRAVAEVVFAGPD